MDVLAALEQLDDLEKESKQKKQAKGKKKLSQSYVSPGARRTRPRSLPPPQSQDSLQPPPTAHSQGERSPSVGAESRRISFADPPRPGARRLWIPTKTDSLASGFVYDPRLNKYNVSEEEWAHFSREIVELAQIPSPTWAWTFHRKNVINRMKKELQYEGDLKRLLRKWNKLFKRQGFSVSLELPTPKGEKDMSDELVGDSQEERDKAKRDAKRFRVVVNSGTEKAASVYSRTSSLSRSVSGEAISVQHDSVGDLKSDAADAEDGANG